MKYYVYFLRCQDQSIYIGTSNQVEKRYQAHKNGKGAKYTKAHPVEKLECILPCESKGEALRLEFFLKTWSKKKKESFVQCPSVELVKSLYKKKILKEKERKEKNIGENKKNV